MNLPVFFKKRSSSSGQALLIILLIMAVGLTIGLSITSRSITDIKISELSEEGARAFSAAEAGIEEVLLVKEPREFTFPETGAKYVATPADFGAGTGFAFPSLTNRNQVQTLWLANYEDLSTFYNRNKLRVVWGDPTQAVNNSSPALEVTIYYKDAGEYKAAKFALDPFAGRDPANLFCNPPSCDGVESFTTGTEKVGGTDFHFGATLVLDTFAGAGKTLLFARLRILYADSQPLGAKAAGSGTQDFPSQGIQIESTGTAGEATRKVRVVRYHPAPLPFFDSVLYSQEDLVHH